MGSRCSPCSDSNAPRSLFVNDEEEQSQLGACFRRKQQTKNTKYVGLKQLRAMASSAEPQSAVLGQFEGIT